MSRLRIFSVGIAALVVLAGSWRTACGADGRRFFHEGDGRIHLVGLKSEFMFNGIYRQASGGYDETAYQNICRVFGAPYHPLKTGLSLRLIAFLDLLEDRFNPDGSITITSGYRDPQYNTQLRQGGQLAAKASLHQYGMAADIKMTGVSSERIWRYVQKLGFGGTGYYHGHTVHIDVGPARSWDETTSGVGTGLSDDNKLIGLVTDFDRYGPNDGVILRFIRMTAFPIGVVPEFVLQRVDRRGRSTEILHFNPGFGQHHPAPCPLFNDIAQMASIRWQLPAHTPPGPYTVAVRFCGPSWEKMPARIVSPVFEVVGP